ncbi:hypothetical protein [Streptomyces dysideae]|uniref:Uncharacterized protein n=1 Tax=Streptomyces dysideae TaxID=909626 RepID=A0A101UTT3_9ACTN|nr:hypothetical protein [Streptomyces dysideae]KUO16738.1 hypothetical protein AQJ91_33735 [Streptomyces dysideae]
MDRRRRSRRSLGCRPRRGTGRQRLALADRPAGGLAVHLRAVEPLRTVTGDADYQQIARLLLGSRACHQHLGTTAEFEDCRTALRHDLKRMRNLVKTLDQHGL